VAREASPAARERRSLRTPVLLITAAAWPVAVWLQTSAMTPSAMPGMPGMSMPAASGGGHDTTTLSPGMLGMWSVMVVAMMAPFVIAPLRHVAVRSLRRRRAAAMTLFVAAFGAVWTAAGCGLLALAGVLQRTEDGVLLALVAVVLWQVTPLKQRCLNQHHARPPLAAYGSRAVVDVARFGVTRGGWCVGSCWALMLLPLVVTRGQLAVMIAVSLWLWAEQFDRPAPARWRPRLPVTALRIARAALSAG
jgi:predicted metal-binding membrane protein